MKRNNSRLLFFTIGFSLFMAVWKQGFAAEKAPFYHGKALTFVINYAAGGPTDIEGTAVEPQMVKTGEVTALYYTDLVSPDGEIMVSADVPELLPFTYYYTTDRCLVRWHQG